MFHKRKAGILMPVYALPSPGGIGTLGRAAYQWIDFLRDARIGVWQMLPVGPTGFGNSPYQSCSAFAGNEYLIDLGMLANEGLLKAEEYEHLDFGRDPRRVDYGKLYEKRLSALRLGVRAIPPRTVCGLRGVRRRRRNARLRAVLRAERAFFPCAAGRIGRNLTATGTKGRSRAFTQNIGMPSTFACFCSLSFFHSIGY